MPNKEVFSRTGYEGAKTTRGVKTDSGVTKAAEQQAKTTGKLRTSIDPSQGPLGPIRLSLIRFESEEGRWVVGVGCPMDVESICDTTGSMGNNVDVAMRVLPDTYELLAKVLPGYDVQLALGIFGDVQDKFILNRMQFEMTADKLVGALADMVPERDGHDATEDPQYGLFGAAYLTQTYTNRIGLKGYHFAISDASARGWLSAENIERVFGEEVWERLAENGQQISRDRLPSTQDVVRDLLKRAHAFFLMVGNNTGTYADWKDLYGAERIVRLPDTKYLPQIQAAIVGLTEGTLNLQDVQDFLIDAGMSKSSTQEVLRDLVNIPIGAQAVLRDQLPHDVPKAGDVFANKTDLWPTEGDGEEQAGEAGTQWL